MFPLLVEIPIFGGLHIYTYGVLVAAAFCAGILWTVREGQAVGIGRDRIFDLSFYIILAALAGSRALYILIEWDRYLHHPLEILKIWQGGLVFYGGLIAAGAVSYLYARRHQLSFILLADLFAPGIALGHAIGRLGCFAAGCCYGREAPAGSWLAVTFPATRFGLAPPGVPLCATQLMESAIVGGIFLTLLFVRRHKKFVGQVFGAYLGLYAVARIFLETFRAGDVRQPFYLHLSHSQIVSLLLFLVAVGLHLRLKGSSR